MENIESTFLDFSSFSENPIMQNMEGMNYMILGIILFICALFYFFFDQIQTMITSVKQSIHEQIESIEKNDPPGMKERFLQYLDVLFSEDS